MRLLEEQRQSTGSLEAGPGPADRQAGRPDRRARRIRATPKLVHRDLKPSNILVERRPDGKIILRVTDFGIGGLAAQPMLERSRSSSLEENMASVLTGAYSPLYASPQQMRGDDPDPRDDVYSLGVIWYQLLTGDLTTPAPTGRRWDEGLRRQGMSDAAIDLLSSCVESDPAHRPADAGVLADLLQKLPRSASTKPADAATELPIREGEAPSEPVLRRSGIDREGEAPSEPALPPGERTPQTGSDGASPSPAAASSPVCPARPAAGNELRSWLAPSPARGRFGGSRRLARRGPAGSCRIAGRHRLHRDRQGHHQDHGQRPPHDGPDRRSRDTASKTWASRSRFKRASMNSW